MLNVAQFGRARKIRLLDLVADFNFSEANAGYDYIGNVSRRIQKLVASFNSRMNADKDYITNALK